MVPPIETLSSRYIHWYITIMRLLPLLILVAAMLTARPAAATGLTVFAAASTVVVMRGVEMSWNAGRDRKLRIVYGSSGDLARQIAAGAPADVYFSAHTKWIDYLAGKNLLRPRSRRTVAANRLVLIAPAASSLRTVASMDHLPDLLGARGRLAIGDPRHVPAGIYAQQALQALGLWTRLAPRTVRSPNVRVALALVERGEAALGVVYASDAAATRAVRTLVRFPADLHDPIRYDAAATATADPRAGTFIGFLAAPATQRLFRDAGFAAP